MTTLRRAGLSEPSIVNRAHRIHAASRHAAFAASILILALGVVGPGCGGREGPEIAPSPAR